MREIQGKTTASQNNNERNDNALDSVLGFLKQAANDDAKPKVPKVPVKDVLGFHNLYNM